MSVSKLSLLNVAGPGPVIIGSPTFNATTKNANITLSSGDTEADWTAGTGRRNIYSTLEFLGASNKKMVFSFSVDAVAGATTLAFAAVAANLSNTASFVPIGSSVLAWDIVTGNTFRDGAAVDAIGTATNGDTVMLGVWTGTTAFGRVIFGKNGTWFTDPQLIASEPSSVQMAINFAAGVSSNKAGTGMGVTLIPWPYAVPAGYLAPGDAL